MKNKVINLLIFIVFILVLCGCNNKYNAVLYNHADKWISEDFLDNNRVKAYYRNENYIEGEDDKYIYDDEAPRSRTFIITDQDRFSEIFSKYDKSIDFDSELVVLYIFSDVSPRDYKIKKIYYENQALTIQIKLENTNKKDSVMPYQRCIMIKMKKLEIESVNFIKVRK